MSTKGLPTHQLVGSTPGTCQSKKPAMQGPSPAHQWVSNSYRPSHELLSQLPQNLALHISGLPPTPGSPDPTVSHAGRQPHMPVGWHQPPDTQEPAPSTSRPTPAPGPMTSARTSWDLLPVMLGAPPTNSWQPSHKAGPGSQLGWGSALTTSPPTVSAPIQQQSPCNLHGGTPRAYSSGDQRGVCCGDPQDISYIRPLQDQET